MAKQNTRCQVPISHQLTVASRPASQSVHGAFSVAVQKHNLHDAVHCCVWDGMGFSGQLFFFPSCQGIQQRNTHGRRDLKEVWMDPHLRGCLCRTCWMLGIPWLLLSTWKAQGPDRQLFSPLPAFPFSSLCSPWKCPFSAFSALSASPSLSSDCSASGTTQFHGFVSLPLLLVMSGPRAIGIFRLPWKKYHRHFQTPLEKHNTVPDVILSC